MILASKMIYQKLSSNGFDLVELEPKPVDHRQIRIDPVPHEPFSVKIREILVRTYLPPRNYKKKAL
jgi:hypothetical protein